MQLPDYLEVIEHPMDFGTVRKKLTNGAYGSLELFEVGICDCDYVFPTFRFCFYLGFVFLGSYSLV